MHSHDDNADQANEAPASRINRLLRELIELSGQQAPSAPVLELLIGEVLTRTSIAPEAADRCLSITALLPKCEQPHYVPRLFSPAGADTWPPSVEFLWHADEGRYIVVNKVPVAGLQDARGIMDAILLTADIARDYFAAIRDDKPQS